MDEIKVTVVSYGHGRNLMLRYVDPITGKQVAKTAGTTDPDKALMEAGKWQDELRSGRYQAPSRLTWEEFRKRVDEEKLSAMPESSQVAYRVALDHLQRIVNPDRVAKLTARVMSEFQAKARKGGMKETTIARNLRHIKAVLRWGERQGLIAKAPAIEMPKVQAAPKHRPVTAEEYDRMVVAVPKVRKRDAPAWQRLLRGLWLSGLRLSEALALDWTDGPFVLDTTGKHPAFVIDAAGQKSRRSEVVPLTPDFAAWILGETPDAERVGKVFPTVDPDTGQQLRARNTVGPVLSAIGKKAGVIVGQSEKVVNENGKRVKRPVMLFAGAHDLRRAFCTRWAKRVMPAVLQRLARHAHISTTMGYYVQLDADEIGADLWANHAPESQAENVGNSSGNTRREAVAGKR